MAVKVKHNGAWVDISGSSVAGKTKCAILEDQKPSNTNGGTFTSGAWRDRTLNSETDPQSFVTLDGGNVYFSLAAGTYEIDWSAPATMVDKHQTRLMFATNTGFSSGVGYVYGSSEYVDQNEAINADCTRSFGTTVKTITETTYFKIQHRCTTTKPNDGFGTPNNFTGDSQVEVYTQVKIQDLATAVAKNADYVAGTTQVAYLYDKKDSGTDGGSFTKDAWRGRDLTTKSDPFSLISSFTATTDGTTTPSPGDDPGVWALAAGKYKIQWKACGLAVNRHKSRLTYATDSGFTTDVGYVYGSSSYAQLEEDTESFGVAILEPSATWYYKIEHYCKTTNSGGDGFGQASDITSVDEIYTQVVVEDLATAVQKNADYVEGTSRVATVKDVKDWNVNGGSFTQDTWVTRDLNTISDPSSIGITSTTGGIVYVPSGTYRIKWDSPAFAIDHHQTRLVYSTDSNLGAGTSTTVAGSNEWSGFYDSHDPSLDASWQTRSFGETVLTLTQTTYFKVEHQCTKTRTAGAGGVGNGLGVSYGAGSGHDIGESSVYTQVSIEDLATAVKSSSNNLLNVWHVQKTDAQTIDTETWTDITGLSQTVTSTSASSRFLINATVNCGMGGDTHDGLVRLMRGTQPIGSTTSESGVSADNTGFGQVAAQQGYTGIQALCITYLDTPGAGTHTYHIEGINTVNLHNMLINRRGTATDFYVTSHMTIQEIA